MLTKRRTLSLAAAAIVICATTGLIIFAVQRTALHAPVASVSAPKQDTDQASAPRNSLAAIAKKDAHRPLHPSLTGPSEHKRLADFDVRDFARRYNALEAAANAGDANAAHELYQGTFACADIPIERGDLDGYLQELKSTNDEDAYRRMSEFLGKRFDDCNALTPSQRASWRHWLERSADLGSLDDAIKYVNAPPEKTASGEYWQELAHYRDKADTFLNSALNTGSSDALLAASMAYGPSSKLYTPDQTKQYAYLFAYLMATNQEEGPFVDIAAKLQSSLTNEELASATELGQKIYFECCRH